MIIDIGPIDAAENKNVVFAFADEVGGANINTASVTAELVTGTDANPAGILQGAVTIDNASKTVAQAVAAPGRSGNTYKLRCQATDANGRVHVIAASLPVVTL